MSQSLKYSLESHPVYQQKGVFEFSQDELENWKKRLLSIRDGEKGESIFRFLSSQESWSFYLKTRPKPARILLAHPNPNEWVATVAFTETLLQKHLDKLGECESHTLDELESIDPVSNLTLEIKM